MYASSSNLSTSYASSSPHSTPPSPTETLPIQLVSEMDDIRAQYPADTRNRMGLDFICHNSFKYTCCLCSERILVHESELVLDKFFEKHRCPKRRSQSAPPDTSGIHQTTTFSSENESYAGDAGIGSGISKAPTNKCKTRLSWYVEWLAYA